MQRQILTMMDVRIRLAAAVLWMIALLMTKHAGTPVIMAVILCCIIACDSGMSVHEAFHHLWHVAPFIFLMLITLSLSDGVPLTREAVGFALLISIASREKVDRLSAFCREHKIEITKFCLAESSDPSMFCPIAEHRDFVPGQIVPSTAVSASAGEPACLSTKKPEA